MTHRKDLLKAVEIANIQLAFDYRIIIPLLTKRGVAISQRQWTKVEKINAEINEYINSPDGNYALCQVVKAFITFKTEDGYNIALDNADKY